MDLLDEYSKMISTVTASVICPPDEIILVSEPVNFLLTDYPETNVIGVRATIRVVATDKYHIIEQKEISVTTTISHEAIYRQGNDIIHKFAMPQLQFYLHERINEYIADLRKNGYNVADYEVGNNGHIRRISEDDQRDEVGADYEY